MTDTAPGTTSTARLEGIVPILRVRSLEASIEHYKSVLGFRVDWQDPGIIGSVSRDGAAILLCQGDQGHAGTWLWIGVDDCERLFAEYAAKGATVRLPPTNYPWALEMQIEDLDGHVLRFGSEPKAERPFGEWLDMRGGRWAMSPAGIWTRVDGGDGRNAR
jgi:catechol 2,3-dioxygenase-like lactoylglutathione lyase family enzyme